MCRVWMVAFARFFHHYIVGATHTHYAAITKTYGLYSSHDALQVPNLLGAVASVCTPLPTRTQQLPTLLAQQCWELLRPFALSLRLLNHWNIHFYNALQMLNFIMKSYHGLMCPTILLLIFPCSKF